MLTINKPKPYVDEMFPARWGPPTVAIFVNSYPTLLEQEIEAFVAEGIRNILAFGELQVTSGETREFAMAVYHQEWRAPLEEDDGERETE